MRKRKNTGFSMVEIIIVVAIMAILGAALAPALIKYINKSKRARDVDAAKEIQAAYTRAVIAMENDTATTNFGSGTDYVRYDTVLQTPAVDLQDYAFSEFNGVPTSSTYKDYYWAIEYDSSTGQVLKISLTPAQNLANGFEVYPDGETFLNSR